MALGRGAPRDVPPSRARRGTGTASSVQPVGAEWRRLEYCQCRRRRGRRAVRTALGRGISSDHRPLARERQPVHRRGRRVRTFPVDALRQLALRLAGRALSAHANVARRCRARSVGEASPSEIMATEASVAYHTSGVVRLTRTQMIGTMTGLVLTMLLSALDQTIIGTAEPRIIATLSGFNRYPWVATAYFLMSTLSIPILGKLSDIYGR